MACIQEWSLLSVFVSSGKKHHLGLGPERPWTTHRITILWGIFQSLGHIGCGTGAVLHLENHLNCLLLLLVG